MLKLFRKRGVRRSRPVFTGLELYSGRGKTLWILGIAALENVSSSENAEAPKTRSPAALQLIPASPFEVLECLADRFS